MRFPRLRLVRALGAALLAGALVITAAGCSSGSSGTTTGSSKSGRGGTLTVALTRAPASFDAGSIARSGLSNDFLAPVYQPLIEIDEKGKLAPSLATKWEWLDDTNTTLKLELRDDAKFSDGSPVTAAGVIAYWQYALQTAYSQYWLGGATFETPTEHEVVVHLQEDKPRPNLPWAFTTSFSSLGWITNPAALKDPDKLKLEAAGAGPYVLDTKNTVTNSTYVYTPNPYFYDKAEVRWDKIVLKVMPQEQTRLAALRTGQVDVAAGAQRQVKAARDAGLQVVLGAGGGKPIIFGDLEGKTVPALADLRVRQALAYAVDWKSIGAGIFGDDVIYNQQIFAEGSEGYLPDLVDLHPYDPKKAERLLAEAGYPDGFDAGQMIVGPVPGNADLAQVLQAQWAKIGVTVQPLVLDPAAWSTQINAHAWPLNVYSSISAPVGPTISALLDSNSTWLSQSDYSGLYALIDTAQRTPADTEASRKAWQDVARYAAENVLYLAGVMPTTSIFAKKDIGGIVMNAPSMSSIMLWYRK
ncbi:ABC transporter substrate-binding protein [Microbacterium sp. USTB-Y]|uniref:ABC transporter substrate-binding protein n=1 Tax=Microbacterium sp. USTB-Y TaxID=2823692 RepID=UPI0020415DE2|nr:ABC transporter substrate-binding protein [Microbacterium sp. USTB-Y]